MITPGEIRKKAARQYRNFCLAWLAGEDFFPLVISGDKGRSTDPFLERMRGIEELLKHAKPAASCGYTLELEEVNTRRYGPQQMVRKIVFLTREDFLGFTGNRQNFEAFKRGVKVIREKMPLLETWIVSNMKVLETNSEVMPELLNICDWFLKHTSYHLYIRELPLEVHTKFIEEHQGVLSSLLDTLLPPERINAGTRDFSRRYHLRWQEPLIRCRFRCSTGEDDLARPLSLACHYPPPGCRIFVIENLINYLTFPLDPETSVIWGSGFGVDALKHIPWLKEKEIYYWGDIDPPGLEILSLFRKHYPQTKAFLMNKQVYEEFKKFAHQCDLGRVLPPEFLTPEEEALYMQLKARPGYARLEQERIPQVYVIQALEKLNFSEAI